MKLSEQIEALLRHTIEQVNAADTNSEAGKKAIIDALRARFAPLLVRAREQERELAHWRWLYSDHGELKKDSKPEQTQHSADSIVREFREREVRK